MVPRDLQSIGARGERGGDDAGPPPSSPSIRRCSRARSASASPGGRWRRGSGRSTTVQIRDFATDKHRSVDDTPAGGGAGMVMRADVLAAAVDHVLARRPEAPMLAMTPARRAADPGPRPRARRRPRRLDPLRPVRGDGRAPVRGAADRPGLDRRLCAFGGRAGRAGPARCLRSAASRGNGRRLPAVRKKASKAAFSNIRIIPGLSNGKGARSPKCCDRGIMRRSPPGARPRRRGRDTAKAAGPDRASRGRAKATALWRAAREEQGRMR